MLTTLLLVVSELGLLQNWFARYLPLVGPKSAFVTLGFIQVHIFLQIELIIRYFSRVTFFQIDIVYSMKNHLSILINFFSHQQSSQEFQAFSTSSLYPPPFSNHTNFQSAFWRGEKAGRMRTIRRYGTPLPDSEKGSISGSSFYIEKEEPSSVLAQFKNAFRKADSQQESPRAPLEISRPLPVH